MGFVRVAPRDLVAAGLYASEEEVVHEALRHLLESRPDLRLAIAAHRYAIDDRLTLATAAARAGVSIERMKEELVPRGVEPRLGPATFEQARDELAVLQRRRDVRVD